MTKENLLSLNEKFLNIVTKMQNRVTKVMEKQRALVKLADKLTHLTAKHIEEEDMKERIQQLDEIIKLAGSCKRACETYTDLCPQREAIGALYYKADAEYKEQVSA